MGLGHQGRTRRLVRRSQDHVRPALESVVGRFADFLQHVHPDDRQAVRRAMDEARTTRTTFRATYRIVRADQTTRWATGIGRFHYSASGEAVRMLGVAADITGRMAIDQARSRLAAIVASCDDPVISTELDGTISTWNASAERVFGFTEAEAIGKPVSMLVPAELRDDRERIVRRLKAGERIERYETARLTRAGRRIDVSLTMFPTRDVAGRIVGISAIAHERTTAEQALRESEERFRLVADTAPVMIWMAGEDTLCNYFNSRWLEFAGHPIETQLGNGWLDAVHPDDLKRCLDTYLQAFERREAFRVEYRMRRHDGEYRWVLDTGVPRFTPVTVRSPAISVRRST